MKRIVISDESLNSYGFWVMTDGIELDAFMKNPVMLWNHNRDGIGTVNAQLPIGYWKDLRKENGVLTGEPVFDETDEFAVRIMRKYEAGVLNACSIGFNPIEWSEDPSVLKEGQTVATVTRCRLLEVSICDIPANPNATVALYDQDNRIINLSELPRRATGHKTNNTDMTKQIALKLGLAEDAGPEACMEAIRLKDDEIASLKAENETLKAEAATREEADKAARRQEAVALLDEAVRTGRIDAQTRPQFAKLFELDHEAAKAALDSLPQRKPMVATNPGSADGNLTAMSWDELDRAELLIELKEKYPEVYQQKFNEKFGKQ